MSSGKIPVRTHEVPLSNNLMGGGTIQISTSSRVTEEGAEERIESGIPHAATDTIGDMKREGLTRCKRCKVYKQPAEFGTYKVRGIEYPRLYCKECRVEMERYKRFENTPGYPRRME